MERQTLSQFLAQETIDLPVGSYLVAHTVGNGYTGIITGQNVYEVQAKGDGKQIVPVLANEDHTELTAHSDKVVAFSDTEKVVFLTNTRKIWSSKTEINKADVPAGQEDKELVHGFLRYVHDEYGFGVHDFIIAEADILTEQAEEDPDNGDGDDEEELPDPPDDGDGEGETP